MSISSYWCYKKLLQSFQFSVQFSSVPQSCPTLYDPRNCSTSGLPVHLQFPESTQIHVHWVADAIQPSHPLSSPSPPAINLSQHQGLFQWVSSLHQAVKVLEFQLQHQLKALGENLLPGLSLLLEAACTCWLLAFLSIIKCIIQPLLPSLTTSCLPLMRTSMIIYIPWLMAPFRIFQLYDVKAICIWR